MKLSEFFNGDYVDFASYDNLRKIASVMDGQKNAARKILYTIQEKNIRDEIKVSQLGSKVAEFAEYLHGNLDGVIVNLAQDFMGTNNIPLLDRGGNFGTRFAPEASASRYIYTHGSKSFFQIFNPEDRDILVKQTFEGNDIEPRFYVPDIPILLVNGSEGVSSGFAQKILPRSPTNLCKAIVAAISGKAMVTDWFTPYYSGFAGTVKQGDNSSQWVIRGVVKKVAFNKISITEIPVGYSLRDYLDVLDKLEDDKVIRSYVDKSENDKFEFEVLVNGKDLDTWDEDAILTKLKLIKRVTENYTVIDENNKIKVFDTVQELFEHYVKVKLVYLQKRKDNVLAKLKSEIDINTSKCSFIEAIISGKLVINNRKRVDIENDLGYMKSLIKIDDSYDYLLNMNILSLTVERLENLKSDIELKNIKYSELEVKSIQEIWKESIS